MIKFCLKHLAAPVACIGLLASTLSAPLAHAADLKIGLAAEPTAMDPHYHLFTPNISLANQIYEPLVMKNPDFSMHPGLAESYRAINPTTWEFKLRKNVKFHDGTAFDANDVLFTFCRVPTVQNSPSPFTLYTKAIKEMEAPDPYTVIIKTTEPYPLLPNELATIGIISDSLIDGEKVRFSDAGCKITHKWPATEEFNSGKAAIGTGPFKFGQFTKGDRIVLKRNDAYWGKKPAWDQVIMRPITNPGSRVAALLSGDVDFIERPTTQDIPRIKADPRFKIEGAVSTRTVFLVMDQSSDKAPPGVKTADGKNPFKDVRVRKALSMAIDRRAIVDRIMGGFAKPAQQLMSKEFFGTDTSLPVLATDVAQAKKLLAEAGYPDGFEMTLATPNDRYINDSQVAQAVAQMFTKIGIKTGVDAMTASTFLSRRAKHEFGIYLFGWGAQTGEMSSPLRGLVATVNKTKGWGSSNYGKFSDATIDSTLDKAMETVDDNKRRALMAEVSKRSMELMAVIPLHYEVTPWAMKASLNYKARADEFTKAEDVTPK
jgi:peptide/nickel transport system substrate-binding protein